ncbi:MAG: DUF92 domain-containing protein [Balneolaceae bacterium]
MDRLVNYIFIFVLIFLFILEGDSADHIRIFYSFLLSLLFSVSFFFLNRITLDALFSAIVIGTIVFGLGGWLLGILVVIFFISSIFFSGSAANTAVELSRHGRRNGLQVWSNGFWFTLLAILWFLTQQEEVLVLAAAAIATVTADTWATELGNRDRQRTVLATNFKNVQPGTDGGISVRGTLAALAGSLLIAFSFQIFSGEFETAYLTVIAASGFFGCFADSCLGALYHQNREKRGSAWSGRFFESPAAANNSINLLASGSGVLIALFLIQWI